MLENGFIILHRKITGWEWYQNSNTFCLFLHLILTANYEPKKFEGITIGVGQRAASFNGLAKETGMSVRQVRTAVNHLKSTGEVTSRSYSKYTVFTVVNYKLYQANRQANRQATDTLSTSQRQATDINETIYNKDNKEKQDIAAPAAENGRRTDTPGATDF